MSDRYADLTYSATVAANTTKSCTLAIPFSIINIAKIRMIQSVSSSPTTLAIYKDAAHTASKKVYSTAEYTGALIDPIEDTGVVAIERNQGFVCAYEDEADTSTLYFTIFNNSAVSVTYDLTITVDITYSHTGSGIVTGVPEQLNASASASELVITSVVSAAKNNSTIDQADFRAIFVAAGDIPLASYDLRTIAEGGTFNPDGITGLDITGITAIDSGTQYVFTSASAGTWFYAWRLHNSIGWSNWTDGNITPSHVTQFVSTRNTADSGPPSDWDIVLQDGPVSNSLICLATRPAVNGDVINGFFVQIKDGSTGAWTSLQNGPDADNLKYDGTAVSLSLSAGGTILTKADGLGWGTAGPGDLVLLDVRGNGETWDESQCQWGTVYYVYNSNTLILKNILRPQVYSDMRAIIIKPPWAWSTGGYLGGYAKHGFWPQRKLDEDLFIGDTDTQQFQTTSIIIPSGVVAPEARVWFENNWSRNDDGINHTDSMIGLPTQMTWTKFNNSRWWTPKYDVPDFALVNVRPDGPVDIAASQPRPSTQYSPGIIVGVQGHFSVHPDTQGRVMMRVKFENVYIPQYSNANTSEKNNEGTILFLTFKSPYGLYTDNLAVTAAWGNYRDEATISFGGVNLLGLDANWNNSNWGYIGGTPTTTHQLITRPTPPYILELRIGLTIGSTNLQHCVTTLEYRLGGTGSYVAYPNVAQGNWGSGNTGGANLFVQGFVPFVGLLETTHNIFGNYNGLITDYTARITEFAVEYGVIRQHRLV
jgi:hypothetical protein